MRLALAPKVEVAEVDMVVTREEEGVAEEDEGQRVVVASNHQY
jgi:hypothetical protein